jgi:hypothetical protein
MYSSCRYAMRQKKKVGGHQHTLAALPPGKTRYCCIGGRVGIRADVEGSLYVPPGLTFNNSAFCPHCVFMCFVWILEQTVIIFLYSINWLVFITKVEIIYCALWAEYLFISQVAISVNSIKPCTSSVSVELTDHTLLLRDFSSVMLTWLPCKLLSCELIYHIIVVQWYFVFMW